MTQRTQRMARGADLNERQRAYLLAIFAVDQAIEADMRQLPYRPFQPRPKASEWRWLEYSEPAPDIAKPASRLYAAIKQTAPIDQGTGSTFAALADRGLIELDWRDLNVWGQRKPYIRLTSAGRRLARSWTGQHAYKAPPAGTLREWHWRALAAAYTAGEQGLPDTGGGYGGIGWSTWRRLEEYGARPGHRDGTALTQVRRIWRPVRRWDGHAYRDTSELAYEMVMTDAGRALYEREWARYRELYPDIEAPEPARAGAGRP
jgi:hypothetical protein